MKRIFMDTETDGLLPELSKIHCLCFAINDGPVKSYHNGPRTIPRNGTIMQGLKELAKADEIVAHNSLGFDIPAIAKVYPKWTHKAKVIDTLIESRLIWSDIKERDYRLKYKGFPGKLMGRHSLESWGHRLKEFKGEYTGGWETFSRAMLDYCVQDVEVLRKLWMLIDRRKYCEKAKALEYRFAQRVDAMNNRGIQLKVKEAKKLTQTLMELEAEVEDKLRKVFNDFEDDEVLEFNVKSGTYVETAMRKLGWEPKEFTGNGKAAITKKILTEMGEDFEAHQVLALRTCPKQPSIVDALKAAFGEVTRKKLTIFNPGSRDHLARALKERHGWVPTEFTDAGSIKFDESVLSHLDYPETPLIMESLMLDKRLGAIQRGKAAWLKLCDEDGIIRPYVNHMGTIYSRCSHSRPNITQVPKMSHPWGPECRACWGPRKGYTMLGADLKSIDLRGLAHYMVKHDGGKYRKMVLAGDPHTYTQKLAGLPERDMAKTLIYMILYGAKKQGIAKKMGWSEKRSDVVRKKILKGLGITVLESDLHDRVRAKKAIHGLDGRVIPIRSQHVALNYLIACSSALVHKMWVSDFLDATDGFDRHLLILAHDEFQIECMKKDVAELTSIALATALGAGSKLGMRIETPADVSIGASWRYTH